jgi:Ohr subfamily peroxiredoxin
MYLSSSLIPGCPQWQNSAKRSGQRVSHNALVDLNLRLPSEMGGTGGGTNPEQLLAAGFAACFHGAFSLLARQQKVEFSRASIDATVAFGRDPADGGYLLTADFLVKWPGADPPWQTI